MLKVCRQSRQSLNLAVFKFDDRNPRYLITTTKHYSINKLKWCRNDLHMTEMTPKILGWSTWHHLDCIWRQLVHWYQPWKRDFCNCRTCFQCIHGSVVLAIKSNLYHSLIGRNKGTISAWIGRGTRSFLWTCSIYSWKQVTWTRFECHRWRCSSNGLQQGTFFLLNDLTAKSEYGESERSETGRYALRCLGPSTFTKTKISGFNFETLWKKP